MRAIEQAPQWQHLQESDLIKGKETCAVLTKSPLPNAMLWEWDTLLGVGSQPEIGWSPHLFSDLEKTVDLEEFFTNNKEMDQLLPTDSQNLGNSDTNKEKSNDNPIDVQDSLLISDEAWALLQEMEANNENNYLQNCSPISPPEESPLPAPLDDSIELSWKEISFSEFSENSEVVNKLPCSENQFDLIKDPLMSKTTEILPCFGNSKNYSVESIVTKLETVENIKDEVPPSAGVDFPLDITTPDVLSLLVNQTVEFPENISSPDLKTIQVSDIESETSMKENAFVFPQIEAVNSVEKASSSTSILSLKIGNRDGISVSLGKGALLQRKRKASRSLLAEGKVAKLSLNDERISVDCVDNASCNTNSCSSDSSSVDIIQIEEPNANAKDTNNSTDQDCDSTFIKPFSDHKYIEMRIKNNEASRRSRKSRKQKEQEMEEQAVKLEKENSLLQMKVDKLEKLTELLKSELIKIVANKK